MEEVKLITTIAQGGSFVLLVAIAAWLMRWVPSRFSKNDEIREKDLEAKKKVAEEHTKSIGIIMDGHAKTSAVKDEEHAKAIIALMEGFKEEARFERSDCDKRHRDLIEQNKEMLKRLEEMQKQQAETFNAVNETKSIACEATAEAREAKHEAKGIAQIVVNRQYLEAKKANADDTSPPGAKS